MPLRGEEYFVLFREGAEKLGYGMADLDNEDGCPVIEAARRRKTHEIGLQVDSKRGS